MRRAWGSLGVSIMFLLIGLGNLIRLSDKVRFHEFVQTSAGGAMCGVALVCIILSCLVLTGTISPWHKKPPEEQPPLREKTAGPDQRS